MPPITKKKPAETQQYETLSKQAQTFLRNKGYSQKFITGLTMMLREAGSVHKRTYYEGPKQSEQEFMWSPMKPGKPVQAKMPDKLDYQYSEFKERGGTVKIPDIGPYFPNTTQYPETYKAFASREGQKFMDRYYVKGWLRKDAKTGEWVIKPPKNIVPRKLSK